MKTRDTIPVLTELKAGDRIRLLHMPNDPDPIPVGTLGTVIMTTLLHCHVKEKEMQVLVKWDNGRSLSCICPPDVFSLVTEEPVSGGVVSPVV